MDLLLNVKCPTHANNECQNKQQKCTNFSSPTTHQRESLETMESSPSTNDTNRENSPMSIRPESFSDIMMKRWNKHIEKTMNKVDVDDAKKLNVENG